MSCRRTCVLKKINIVFGITFFYQLRKYKINRLIIMDKFVIRVINVLKVHKYMYENIKNIIHKSLYSKHD